MDLKEYNERERTRLLREIDSVRNTISFLEADPETNASEIRNQKQILKGLLQELEERKNK